MGAAPVVGELFRVSAGSGQPRENAKPIHHSGGACNDKKASDFSEAFVFRPGDFLLSHTLARAVQSGLRGLTTVFGMGTGGSLSLRSPRRSLIEY
jgi:hypothetical protein